MVATEFSADSDMVPTCLTEMLIVEQMVDTFGQIRASPVIDCNCVSAMWINTFEHDVR